MFRRHHLWMLLPLLAVGCGRADGDEDVTVAPAPFVLSAAEIRQARDLAEKHMQLDPSAQAKTVFVKAELLPDSQAETRQRHLLVTHYQYRGDETILTVVDLRHHEILKVDRHAHFPTALATEEVALAEKLARNDPRLHTRLETSEPAIRLECRPYQATASTDPLHGRRVVEFQLLQGDRRLSSPLVRVDLTTETVHIVAD